MGRRRGSFASLILSLIIITLMSFFVDDDISFFDLFNLQKFIIPLALFIVLMVFMIIRFILARKRQKMVQRFRGLKIIIEEQIITKEKHLEILRNYFTPNARMENLLKLLENCGADTGIDSEEVSRKELEGGINDLLEKLNKNPFFYYRITETKSSANRLRLYLLESLKTTCDDLRRLDITEDKKLMSQMLKTYFIRRNRRVIDVTGDEVNVT